MGTFCCICIAEVSRHMGPYMINLLLKLHIGIVDISETVLQLPRDSKLISLQIYIYQEFIIVTIVSPFEQSLINKNIYIYIYIRKLLFPSQLDDFLKIHIHLKVLQLNGNDTFLFLLGKNHRNKYKILTET